MSVDTASPPGSSPDGGNYLKFRSKDVDNTFAFTVSPAAAPLTFDSFSFYLSGKNGGKEPGTIFWTLTWSGGASGTRSGSLSVPKNNTTIWTLQTASALALANITAATTFTLAFTSSGLQQGADSVAIDGVQLAGAPEPAPAATAIALGLAGLAGVRRRRDRTS